MDIITYAALQKKIASGGGAASGVFYVPFVLTQSGFALDGLTFDDIMTAYNSGKQIVGKAYVPSEANMGFAGYFEIPMTHVGADRSFFVLSFISGETNCEVFIESDSSVGVYIRNLQDTAKCVQTITNTASASEYPSAKAVYELVGGLRLRKAFSAKPANPAEGDVYYNTSDKSVQVYTGGAWSTAVAADAGTIYFVT